MSSKILMLSVRPKFAEKIFDGSKTIELRRIKPNLSQNDTLIIYVSSPIKQIKGFFSVEKIIQKPLDELWSSVQYSAGVSKEEFYSYFSGVAFGYGIYIGESTKDIKPITLNEIRKQWEGFTPPQSFRYLSQYEFELLQMI